MLVEIKAEGPTISMLQWALGFNILPRVLNASLVRDIGKD